MLYHYICLVHDSSHMQSLLGEMGATVVYAINLLCMLCFLDMDVHLEWRVTSGHGAGGVPHTGAPSKMRVCSSNGLPHHAT